ncbi:MAG: antibiotic biosynthesis monooxygenase family protein [Chloroflexota bacterium]|nr:antibiotic biosynthesis monooxygenase [Dehalococcoidia bacterium]MDW8255274.1 antibiotic biosynthesis monooxygenase family protein [Chloroflexota bacterium]
MWILHVKATVQPGGNAHYEAWKFAEGALQRKAPGFIKRTLVRSRTDPRRYFYQSVWESADQARAFLESAEFQALFAQHRPRDVLEGAMERDECDLIFDEAAER